MPTVFLPHADASVLDVAGVLALVLLLLHCPSCQYPCCFSCSQLLQASLLLLTCMLLYEQCSPAVTVQLYDDILVAQVVKILYFRIENKLAE